MKKLPKLSQVYFGLLYFFPTALFLSYYPIITLGQSETMNFELSVALLFLVIFDLVSLIVAVKNRLLRLFITPKNLIFLLFPLYSSLSIFWSENRVRAFLTAGILWLVYFAIFSIIILGKKLKSPSNHWSNIQKSIIIPAIVVSIWCWIQCALDIFGISRDSTLLCLGCTYKSFGFPHPNGFAIEPQFMGNLLLAPALLSLYLWFKNPKNPKLTAILLFLVATLFLIFSRGAIYAFILAAAGLIITTSVKEKTKIPLLSIPLICLSFLFSLNAQGIMSTLSPTSDTYISGVTKVVDQLTLGIFHLSPEDASELAQDVDLTQDQPSQDLSEPLESDFSGYVAQSTNIRLNLTSVALTLWSSNPKNIFFGVGLGSAGVSLYNASLLPDAKEIVQNEYASILLETGLVGAILIILTIPLIYSKLKIKKHRLLILAIIFSYAISLFFFAGLPNALHIYIVPAILCYNGRINKEEKCVESSDMLAKTTPKISC